MNVEAFCYLGLLRFPEQLEASLALLRDGDREQASNLLASVKELPNAELLQRWSKLRNEEAVALHKDVDERTGIPLEAVPPSLREWLVAWLTDQND
ncbi:MAG: hypothetical protein ACM34E_11905 [Acidobacteriota bacterium]